MQSRIASALTLYAFVVLGLFLLVAPWTPAWTQATYALTPEGIGHWVLSGWARGIASGLGALDLLIAVQVGAELWQRLRRSRREREAPADAGRRGDRTG